VNEIKVKDLMVSLDEYATVSANTNIKEALEVLSQSQKGLGDNRHRHRAILVLDERGNVVGKLTHWSLLRRLELRFFTDEDYDTLAHMGVSSVFIESIKDGFSLFQSNLTQLCRKTARLKARDAMVKVEESVDQETTLVEAIRLMVLGHWQSMLVRRDGVVVGILRLSDVFEAVADLIRKSDINK
jgi:CBS domain-containing protein